MHNLALTKKAAEITTFQVHTHTQRACFVFKCIKRNQVNLLLAQGNKWHFARSHFQGYLKQAT